MIRGYKAAARTACLALAAASVWGQTATASATGGKASAYYHAALGHLYAELAAQYGGRGEYVSKAIENYRLAMKADPDTPSLAQQLADLYTQSGQLRSATAEFEEAVRRNPNDVNARRILGRFYTARIREGQQGRPNAEMLRQAIAQLEAVGERAPKDVDNWILLGRLQKLAQNSSSAERAYKKALEVEPENEDALTGLAIVYSDLGDTLNASQMLKRVADRNPNLRTLTALAAAYEQMKEFKLAAETYKRAFDMNRENPDLKRAYAAALFSAEEYDDALKLFDELQMEDPNDLLAILRLSQIHRQRRDYAKAHEFARRARKIDPNNLEILYNEVGLLEAEGKPLEAVARLKEILDGMPRKPDSMADRNNRAILLERLAFLYRFTEQTAKAVATYREISELDPTLGAKTSAQIVDAYRAGKDYASAEKEMQAALQKYPDDRIVKLLAANVQTDLARFKEAEALLKSLVDGKEDRDNWIALAQLYEKAKSWDRMADALTQAEKLSKSDEEMETVVFMRGAMYERQKKYDLAEVEFRRVLKMNPKSASAMNYLGYMLADRNTRLQEALELIQKAVAEEPHNSAFLDSLGWVYYRLNRLDDAAEQLRQSIKVGSRDATVHDHLGDVYLSQNRLKDAISQWERAIAEWQSSSPADADPVEVSKIQKKVEGAKVRLARESGARKDNDED
jgi:tetratricopeptide (TPR) repeat protein